MGACILMETESRLTISPSIPEAELSMSSRSPDECPPARGDALDGNSDLEHFDRLKFIFS
jgi:hypothetical protein